MEFRAYDIDWDVSPEDIADGVELPNEVFVEVPEDEAVPDDYITDYLSDEYGWCVNSYQYEPTF